MCGPITKKRRIGSSRFRAVVMVRTLLGLGLVVAAVAAMQEDSFAQQGYDFGFRFRPIRFRPHNFRGFSYQGQTFRPMFGQPLQFKTMTFPPKNAPPIRSKREREDSAFELGDGRISLRTRDGHSSRRGPASGPESNQVARAVDLTAPPSPPQLAARAGPRTPYVSVTKPRTRLSVRPLPDTQSTAQSRERSTLRLSADEFSDRRRR